MDEATLKAIASQLRKPEGEVGLQTAEMMNANNAFITRLTIERLRIAPNDDVLEIGMGNGLFVKEILNTASVLYTGFDYSETMIAEAQKRNAAFVENGRAEFVHGTADALPFKDHSFDKIFAVNVIYFWDTPAKELSQIHRTLKPNGVVAFGIRPISTMKNYPFAKYGFTQYSEESLSALLETNGFAVRDTTEQDEPDVEVEGKKTTAVSLVVTAQKKN